jgi:hypothetical protein
MERFGTSGRYKHWHVCVSHHPEGVEKLSSLKEMETLSWLAHGVHSESVCLQIIVSWIDAKN